MFPYTNAELTRKHCFICLKHLIQLSAKVNLIWYLWRSNKGIFSVKVFLKIVMRGLLISSKGLEKCPPSISYLGVWCTNGTYLSHQIGIRTYELVIVIFSHNCICRLNGTCQDAVLRWSLQDHTYTGAFNCKVCFGTDWAYLPNAYL